MKSKSLKLSLSVRFSETDAMGVVWHGNYLKFFEDAREEFGRTFKMEYLDIYKKGFFVPIVSSQVEHKASVYYGDDLEIIITLIRKKSAKIQFQYEVYKKDTDIVVAIGETTQVFLNSKSRLLELNKPCFYIDWENNLAWES